MKLNMKLIAVAAAMVAAGSANAALVGSNIVGSSGSSVALVAFSTSTQNYYVRDLGLTLNDFLPSSVTTLAGDGGATGNKTPESGLSLNKTTNSSFADSSFATWLAGQNAADVRWTLAAGDSLTSGANGVARFLLASSSSLALSNGQVRTAAAAPTSLAGQNPGMGLSATGATVLASYTGNNILDANSLSFLNVASSLYYFAATTQTGSSSVLASGGAFGNTAGLASVTLASNGDFSYTLAPASVSAVPVPAAAWLLGSGLLSMGGYIRRRKAAAAV